MTKAELTERIIDRITDPWTESPEDYEYADLLDLDSAKDVLKQYREDDVNEGWDEDDRMPDEVTPELFMEVYNCNVRKNRHELQVKRLAEYLTDNEDVCLHNNARQYYDDPSPEVIPVHFLDDPQGFYFYDFEPLTPLDYCEIFGNSRSSFNPNHEYCWFNKKEMKLYSSDTPFHDGVIDATTLATFIIDAPNHEWLTELLYSMDPEDFQYVFGFTEEEVKALLPAEGE